MKGWQSSMLEAIETLFDFEVSVGQSEILDSTWALHPDEEAYVERAVARRRREFATGRKCGREALTAFGFEDFPIHVGAGRAPVWPPGILGSISHTDTYCVAVATRCDRVSGLGIDIETRGRIDRPLFKQICTEAELECLARMPTASQDDWVTTIFSAKEAIFKCQFPSTGEWLDFHDISLNFASGEFVALDTRTGRDGDFAALGGGRYRIYPGVVMTAAVWREA